MNTAMGLPETIMSACVDLTAVVICRCDTGCLQYKHCIALEEGLLTWTGQWQHPATTPCNCSWY